MHEFKNKDILYFARLTWRNKGTLFGIKQADRLLHTYIIGKTGTGKTTLLKTKILQDIQQGRGVCLLDPHGDLVSDIESKIPEHRKNDVIYMNITDHKQPWAYNPLKKVSYEKRSLVASSIIEVFKKLWSQAWGVKLEHILRFTLLALLDQPSARMSDISKMLYDKSFRNEVLENVVNEDVKIFWKKEFPRYMYNDVLPVLNKIGGLLAYPAIKRVIIENKQEISLRKIMDDRKILLVNLSKGAVGEDVAQILGALLLTSIASAAFSRVNIEEKERIPFFVYLDEFQNFSTLSLVNMLSELRKYKVGMVLAHQYMKQLEQDILDAVLGNVGTHISFRVDTGDASIMAKKMYPTFDVEDFVNLANRHIYLTLMIDGTPSRPFSAETIAF
ncbi:MAG: type IV secretory system conjugative DNA transfer family protein [Bacteroidia bacterium]